MGNRNHGLDALRAMAALLVCVCHLALYGSVNYGPFERLAINGSVGVVIFIAISGYVIYRPFAAGRVDRGRYLLRRVVRIYPAYLVALVGASLLLGDASFAQHPIAYLTLTQTFDPTLYQGFLGVAWTLTIEMTFYLLLPLIAFVPIRHHPLTLAAVIALSLTVAVATRAGNSVTGVLFPFMAWAFVPGMALAYLSVHRPAAIRPMAHPAVLLAGVGCVTLGMYVGFWTSVDVISAAGALLLVGWTIARQPNLRWVAAAGASLSYGFYLWHEEILWALRGQLSGLAMAVVVLLAGIAVAGASFVLIERPALRLLSRRELVRAARTTEAREFVASSSGT